MVVTVTNRVVVSRLRVTAKSSLRRDRFSHQSCRQMDIHGQGAKSKKLEQIFPVDDE